MLPCRALIASLPFVTLSLLSCAQPPAQPSPAPAPAPLQREEGADLSRFFPGCEGSFLLVEGGTGRTVRYNPERLRERFLPASTFKIPNSLIALETGVADGPDFFLPYDSAKAPRQEWWPDSWAKDQTMRTALRDSVVWYYQELARRIGPERMRDYVTRFRYGNADLSGGIDRFWLGGGLRISAEEQADFLRRFYDGKLGVSERSTRTLKEILVLEETPEYRLSGKSGTFEVSPTREVGWLVGYVERETAERGGKVAFYALNMEGERVWEDWPPRKRAELTREILRELGALP